MKSPLFGLGDNGVCVGRYSGFDGYNQAIFNGNMVKLLDKLFMNGNYEILSREQEIFVRKYVDFAGEVTDRMLENDKLARYEMPDKLLQFDTFLGSL